MAVHLRKRKAPPNKPEASDTLHFMLKVSSAADVPTVLMSESESAMIACRIKEFEFGYSDHSLQTVYVSWDFLFCFVICEKKKHGGFKFVLVQYTYHIEEQCS